MSDSYLVAGPRGRRHALVTRCERHVTLFTDIRDMPCAGCERDEWKARCEQAERDRDLAREMFAALSAENALDGGAALVNRIVERLLGASRASR